MSKNTKIHEEMKAVASKFKDALISGEYELLEADIHTARVVIFGFELEIWYSASRPEVNFNFWNAGPILQSSFTSNEERLAAHEMIMPKINEYRGTTLKEQKVKQLKALQAEIASL
jgi:hypothetical protein